jgi:glutamine cyclotransferase
MLSLIFWAAAALSPAGLAAGAPLLPVELLNSRPHAASSYTQGLFYHAGRLYESSGLYGRSALFSQSLAAGQPEKTRPLGGEYFGEGADLAEGEIYLLTWRNRRGFVLDPETLAVKREFTYQGEGWGLAWDGERFWRSDGSAGLFPHRAGDFAALGPPLAVRDGDKPVTSLNELEWDAATGLLLANVYGSDLVAAIDPEDGAVRFWLDAAPLRRLAEKAGLDPAAGTQETALNGLALDDRGLWLTGKLWPRLFQVVWPPAGAPLEGKKK